MLKLFKGGPVVNAAYCTHNIFSALPALITILQFVNRSITNLVILFSTSETSDDASTACGVRQIFTQL